MIKPLKLTVYISTNIMILNKFTELTTEKSTLIINISLKILK